MISADYPRRSRGVAATLSPPKVHVAAAARRRYVFNSSGVRVVARLRLNLFSRMLAQDTAWFDDSETGDLLSRLASDTAKIQSAATESVSVCLRSALMAVVSLVLCFATSWKLTLVALGVVPCLCAVTFVAVRAVTDRSSVRDHSEIR